MRLLFIKKTLAWPRSSGHDIYTYYTMKACAELGHEVSLATKQEPPAEAIAGLSLANRWVLDASRPSTKSTPASWIQRRFRSYWGTSESLLESVRQAVAQSKADAAVLVGLDILPLLPVLDGVTRVWFAADEMVRHHLSQVKVFDPSTWHQIKTAAIMGAYERSHSRLIDRSWVVSEPEQRAMRTYGGMKRADLIPLGVDSDYYAPSNAEPEPNTAICWGRLDFGPNVQAMQWFLSEVWPIIRKQVPEARFTMVGFNPIPEIRKLAETSGVTLMADVPDLRETARRHAVLALPFVSGGGAKNKLLEGAALGLPIVCSPLATQGLLGLDSAPLRVATHPEEFAKSIMSLWNDEAARRRDGSALRAWVVKHHSWTASGQAALNSLK